MMRPTFHVWLRTAVLLVLGVLASPVLAASSAIRLERVDGRECERRRLVRVYTAEVELDGFLVSRPYSDYRLLRGRAVVAKRPRHVTTFAKSGEPLHLVLIVENAAPWRADLPRIARAAEAFCDRLPHSATVTVMSYGTEVRHELRQGNTAQARRAVADLVAEPAGVERSLLRALRTALLDLAAAPPGDRRAIVIASDGIDRQPDWDAFRAVARRALAQGVGIFPLAYSPTDDRGPLLNLGELAKRSNATFRWVRQRAGWRNAFDNLARELGDQLVLSYLYPQCGEPATLRVAVGDLRSNEVDYVPPGRAAAGSSDTTRRWGPWLFTASIAVAIALLVLATMWLLRGLGRAPRPPAAPSDRRRRGTSRRV